MYRRNSDDSLRELERRAKQGDWFAKLQYNFESVRIGKVPPPDFHVYIPWTPEEISRWPFNDDIQAVWRPALGEKKREWKRWFFPNCLGVSTNYDKENPLPGRAPYSSRIPIEEHELEAVAFRWCDKKGNTLRDLNVAIDFGRVSENLHVATHFPGVPTISYLSVRCVISGVFRCLPQQLFVI